MAFPYRFVAFDLDGTTIDRDHVFHQETIDALAKAKERGAMICVATGRPFTGIPEEVRNLPMIDYVICANGAMVYDMNTGELLQLNPISVEKAEYLLNIIQSWHAPYQIGFSDRYVLGYSQLAATVKRMRAWKDNTESIWTIIKRVREFFDLTLFPRRMLKSHPAPIVKIACYAPTERICQEHLTELQKDRRFEAVTTGGFDIEITDKNATKGAAIDYVCELLQIPKSERIFFGDSGNDVSARDYVAHFVAMCTASEDVTSIADEQAPSVSEHGVAQVLNRLLAK